MTDLGTPRQERSKQALERFLAVAADLLANDEFEETSIARIAQLAGSSVGTFYRLLGDKDVLLYAVHGRFVQEGRIAIDHTIEEILANEVGARAQVERFIQTLVELFREREGLLRALIRRSSTVEPEFREHFHELNGYIANAFSRMVVGQGWSMRHPDPDQATHLVGHLLLAGLNYYTLTGTLGLADDDEIPAELSRLVLSYLEVPPAHQA